MNTKHFSIADPDTRVYNFMAGGAGIPASESPMKFAKSETGVLSITDMPVFRSGTFRDSWGDQMTWEAEHMQQMVDNFDLLSSRNLVDSVPVRDGHPAMFSGLAPGAGEVVGWHTGLRIKELTARDGITYTYLLADYEITEPHAIGKVERRTWRNRSSEIGRYVTNQEAEYWPVYLGFAYVDLPAVEHLNGHSKAFSKESNNRLFFMSGEGAPVGDKDTTPATPAAPAAPAVPAAPAAPATPVAQHSAPAVSVKLFGRDVTDLGEIQRHIDTLEQFQADTRKQARVDFVNGLATANKILAGQVEATAAFAQTLTDEQYSAWCGTWSAAGTVPGLGEVHGQSATTEAPAAADAKASRIKTLEDTVAMHSRNGMPKERLEKLASYVELQQLKAS